MSDPLEPKAPSWMGGPKPPPDDDDNAPVRRRYDEPSPAVIITPDGDQEFGIVPGGNAGGDRRERDDEDL